MNCRLDISSEKFTDKADRLNDIISAIQKKGWLKCMNQPHVIKDASYFPITNLTEVATPFPFTFR